MMHLWAVGGPESGHALVDIDAFGREYFNDPRHFAVEVNEWMKAYLANPCGVSEDARAWVIAVEERAPGTLAASITLAAWSGPDSLLEHFINAAYEKAEQALYDNPNLYRCQSSALFQTPYPNNDAVVSAIHIST
jgi:hypothetical protein